VSLRLKGVNARAGTAGAAFNVRNSFSISWLIALVWIRSSVNRRLASFASLSAELESSQESPATDRLANVTTTQVMMTKRSAMIPIFYRIEPEPASARSPKRSRTRA
jgi:hypothetical protein